MLVDEQLRGGIVQGLGAALFEECRYSDTGQLVNGSLADYLVPMPMEMPDIVIAHVETPTADTELGAKGSARPVRLRRPPACSTPSTTRSRRSVQRSIRFRSPR